MDLTGFFFSFKHMQRNDKKLVWVFFGEGVVFGVFWFVLF